MRAFTHADEFNVGRPLFAQGLWRATLPTRLASPLAKVRVARLWGILHDGEPARFGPDTVNFCVYERIVEEVERFREENRNLRGRLNGFETLVEDPRGSVTKLAYEVSVVSESRRSDAAVSTHSIWGFGTDILVHDYLQHTNLNVGMPVSDTVAISIADLESGTEYYVYFWADRADNVDKEGDGRSVLRSEGTFTVP